LFGHDWPLEGRVLAERPKPGWAKRHRGLELAAPRQFVIEYDLAGKTQRVELEVKADKIVALSVGDKVPLLVDRKSARVKFDLRDPQLNRILAREAREGADKDEVRRATQGRVERTS
jgi:hypothetical protein